MPPKFKFAKRENVLCFHGPLIYEAKCLKASVSKENQIKYFIRYAGGNKNWDEWVPESRVLKYNETNVLRQKAVEKAHISQPSKCKKKYNETNVLRQKEVQNAHASKSKKAKRKAKPVKDADCRASTPNEEVSKGIKSKPSSPSSVQDSGSDVPRKKRGKSDPSVESEEQFQVKVKVKMPDELKPWLVDDCDVINRQGKLAILPAKISVDEILDNYLTYKKSSKTNNANKERAVTEVIEVIKEYFNILLGTKLLYKFERPQYEEILQDHPDSVMSQIYGAIHLLRLFVKLNSAYTSLDEKTIQLLLVHIHDFLKYLVKNSSTLFSLQHYGNAPPEYHRKAQ